MEGIGEVKVSLIIPYKKRLANLKLLFESLVRQTMACNEFEVVVGAMEYCSEYVALCNTFQEQLNIKTVMSAEEWQVGYARNLALRQADGKIVVLLDADMILSPNFLTNLFENHFAYGQNQCIIGQMIDYDNNTSQVDKVQVRPYSHYETKLQELEAAGETELDLRAQVRMIIPWAFVWTALIALPRQLILDHHLFFDLNFRGYGVEDLEWGYRICKAGIPVSLKKDVWGIHLPHLRNIDANLQTEKRNYYYFLKKWPGLDVEITCALGDFQGNCNFPKLKNEIAAITGNHNSSFSVLTGRVKGLATLVVGALGNADGSFANVADFPEFDGTPVVETLPLAGLALPYQAKEYDRCYVMPTIEKLSLEYQDLVNTECERVAQKVLRKGEGNV